jgi:hypothetical protein
MTSRTKILAQRRAMLTTECALQRITLLGQTQSLGYVGEWITTSRHLVDRLKNLPGWVSALLVGLVIFIPKSAVPLAKNGLLLWQIWRAISSKSSA